MKLSVSSLLKAAWFAIVLAAIAWWLYSHPQAFAEGVRAASAPSIAASFAILALGKLIMALIAYRVLQTRGAGTSFQTAFYAYNISQLAKYIPGAVWQHASRLFIYREQGLSMRLSAEAVIAEAGWLLISALVFSAVILGLVTPGRLHDLLATAAQGMQGAWWLFVLGGVCLIALAAFGWAVARRRLEAVQTTISAALQPDPATIGLFLLLWVVLGASLFALIPGQDWDWTLLYVSGVFAAAYAIGFIAPFAPAGLGVREAVLGVGLAPLAPLPVLVVLIALHRLLYLAADVVFALIAAALGKQPRQLSS